MSPRYGPSKEYEFSLTLVYRAILDQNEMNYAVNTANHALGDEALLKLATELRFLATGLKRCTQRKSVLRRISGLVEMRPLLAMQTETLSTRVGRGPGTHTDADKKTGSDFEVPGYL